MDFDLTPIAKVLEEVLSELYGERMGFGMIIFRFSNVGVGDYLSNAQRPDMIKALREAADRLEAGEDIPKTIGEA